MSFSQRVHLSLHPDSAAAAVREVDVEVARDTSSLLLTYVVRGGVGAVALPKKTAPARTDGLWQHTCFEAFLREPESAAYWEFNFSPSREWAAYRFDRYRQGMAEEPAIADPHIGLELGHSELRLSAALDLSGIAALAPREAWAAGFSAVIEDRAGGRSYWALAHPPGKPDFHHSDGFSLHLAPQALHEREESQS